MSSGTRKERRQESQVTCLATDQCLSSHQKRPELHAFRMTIQPHKPAIRESTTTHRACQPYLWNPPLESTRISKLPATMRAAEENSQMAGNATAIRPPYPTANRHMND